MLTFYSADGRVHDVPDLHDVLPDSAAATKPRYYGNVFLTPRLSVPDYITYLFRRIRTYPDSIGRKERAAPLEKDEKEVMI